MSAEDTIRILLMRDANRHGPLDPAEWQRVTARVAWVRETMAAWWEAQRKVEQAWDRIFAALPEDLSDEEVEAIPLPPEQAELDAIHAEIRAVIDHDRWPRGLHFKGI